MAPVPATPAIVAEFASLSADDDNSDHLPLERDDDHLKRGRIASIMKMCTFTGKAGDQDRRLNENEWNDLMRLVYDDDLYGKMTSLVAEVKKIQGVWDTLRSLGASREFARTEQILLQLLQTSKTKGQRAEAPLSQLDAALGRELLTLNITLRQNVQNVAGGAKTDGISVAINAIKGTLSDPAFEMLETFVKKAGEKYLEALNYFAAMTPNKREAMLVDFWDFYRRVRNTQTHALMMMDLARNVDKWLKSGPTAIAASIASLLLDMQGNVLCDEVGDAWKIYSEEIKPALQLENETSISSLLTMRMPGDVYTNDQNKTNSGNDAVSPNLPNCVLIYGMCAFGTPSSGAASTLRVQLSESATGKTLRVVTNPKDATEIVSWFNLPKSLVDSGDVRFGYEMLQSREFHTVFAYEKPFAKGVKPKVFAWLVKAPLNYKAGAVTTISVSATPMETYENENCELRVDRSHDDHEPLIGYLAIHPRRTDIIGKVLTFNMSDTLKQGAAKDEPLKVRDPVTLHTNAPKQKMPIVTTFISGYDSRDHVKAVTCFPTSSNAFVEVGTRARITYKTIAYWPPEDQKVILPSLG
ncbi:hypothetical protein CBER1_07067 [Cercospora berteroae]|uniref:Uncharacterized protein n=1 Tax=Cercospora berteroae TaxID=357750 RepID=A0A2S6C6Z3_9PEZI|nr:hypothetical protein CBER1_07067 [Cercospora berteroae]